MSEQQLTQEYNNLIKAHDFMRKLLTDGHPTTWNIDDQIEFKNFFEVNYYEWLFTFNIMLHSDMCDASFNEQYSCNNFENDQHSNSKFQCKNCTFSKAYHTYTSMLYTFSEDFRNFLLDFFTAISFKMLHFIKNNTKQNIITPTKINALRNINLNIKKMIYNDNAEQLYQIND